METVRFDELDLCQEILRGVKEMGLRRSFSHSGTGDSCSHAGL